MGSRTMRMLSEASADEVYTNTIGGRLVYHYYIDFNIRPQAHAIKLIGVKYFPRTDGLVSSGLNYARAAPPFQGDRFVETCRRVVHN